MTDFGSFLDEKINEKQAAIEAAQRERDAAKAEVIAARQALIAPILEIAVPVLEQAKSQLDGKQISLTWSDNANLPHTREQVEVQVFLAESGKPRQMGVLRPISSIGVAILYKGAFDAGPAISIGNAVDETFCQSDVEKLIKHLIEKHAGL